MNKIIEKCDVCINGSVVSKELLIKTFSSFVSSTIEDKQHNVGIVLHTGSVCFDAILLSFAAISNVLYNETNATDIVLSLQADDLVLCYDGNTGNSKPLKWIFKGFVNSVGDTPLMTPGKYIVLESDKNGRKYLPESRWTKLYHTLDRQNPWTVEDFAVKVKKDMTFSGLFWGWRMQKFPELLIHQR